MVKELIRVSACLTALLVAVLVINQPQMWKAMGSGSDECEASSCGHIHKISYPFRLKSDPPSCGSPTYELDCENYATLVVYLNSTKFYVEAINYDNYTIRLVDAGVFAGRGQYCTSFPSHPLITSNFGFSDPYTSVNSGYQRYLTLINCGIRMESTDGYVDYSSCINKSSSATAQYRYVKVGFLDASDIAGSCLVEQMGITSLVSDVENNIFSLDYIQGGLVFGFELYWYMAHCDKLNCSRDDCYLTSGSQIGCLAEEAADHIACPALRDITVDLFFPFPKLGDFRWLLHPDNGFVPRYTTDNGSSRCGIKDILLYIALWFGIASIIVID